MQLIALLEPYFELLQRAQSRFAVGSSLYFQPLQVRLSLLLVWQSQAGLRLARQQLVLRLFVLDHGFFVVQTNLSRSLGLFW